MKRTKLSVVLVGLVAITVFTSDAFARGRYFHTRLGRFMQRDPVGTAVAPQMAVSVRPALQRNISAERFLQRDPIPGAQYADGMNLYECVRSNPITRVDPDGLWGRETHYGKSGFVDGTYEIAKRVGFNDKCAEVLAAWNQGVDDVTPAWAFPYYHFEPGRSVIADSRWKTGVDKLKRANVYLSPWIWDVSVYDGLAHIGEALHGYQDAFAHSPAHYADTPLKHVTGPNAGQYTVATRFHQVGDSLNYRPDDPDMWPPADHAATVADTDARLNEIWKIPSVKCHCK